MKAVPFQKVKIGQVFRDIDGNSLLRIPKVFRDNEGRDFRNCVILIANKSGLSIGDIMVKTREIYCELLNDTELNEIRLTDIIDNNTDNMTE